MLKGRYHLFTPENDIGRSGSGSLAASLFLAVFLVVGCGADSEGSEATSTLVDSGDSSGQGDEVPPTSDGVEGQLSTSERPDWLPTWVLLPPGLNTSAATFSAGTGEAVIVGSVPDSDPAMLYSDAVFMIQSAGFVIVEEFDSGEKGFTAEHTGDGSTVRFTVATITDGLSKWGLEFSGMATTGSGAAASPPASGASDIDLDSLEGIGSLTFSVVNPRINSRVEVRCSTGDGRAEFMSEDGSTRFLVLSGSAPSAAGEITLDLDGETVTWVAAAESDTAAAEVTDDWVYYEGDFLQGTQVTFGIVQITCDE